MHIFKKTKVYILKNTDYIEFSKIEKFVHMMPKERILKYYRLLNKKDKTNCVSAYLLIWFALKKNYGFMGAPKFNYGPNKKPSLSSNKKIFFNISHTNSAVILAIGTNSVGIDIEKKRPIPHKLAKKICTKKECCWFANAFDKTLMFFYIWTRKESFCKKTGDAIFPNLKKINAFSLKNVITFDYHNFVFSFCCDCNNFSFFDVDFETITNFLF